MEATLRTITALSPAQSDLLMEAALAARAGLYRSAMVSAFAALVDALHVRIDRKGTLPAVAAARGWTLASVEDLRDQPDYAVAEAAKVAGAINKAEMKSVHGLLHRRNQCAHPSGYAPTIDECLGYMSETLRLIDAFARP